MELIAKHRTAAVGMWSSLALAAIAVLVVMPTHALAGLVSFCAFAFGAGLGAWYKKQYCPRCNGPGSTCDTTDHPPGNSAA